MMKLIMAFRRVYCWVFGHLLVFFGRYDKRYLTGRHFHGDISGRFAIGWEWVVNDYVGCRRLRRNRSVPWPVSPLIGIVNAQNIHFHPDDLNNFQGVGNYFQGDAEIHIGRGTYIAQNVGLITGNHDLYDPDLRSEPKPISIGEKSWIGMNAVILPGVVLGPHTVVAAGAVVTKSFPEGGCVLAGVPAVKIKELNDSERLTGADNGHTKSGK